MNLFTGTKIIYDPFLSFSFTLTGVCGRIAIILPCALIIELREGIVLIKHGFEVKFIP
jgi:hypothetical protein